VFLWQVRTNPERTWAETARDFARGALAFLPFQLATVRQWAMPQSLVAVYIHLVFSSKDRRPFLRDKATRDALHS